VVIGSPFVQIVSYFKIKQPIMMRMSLSALSSEFPRAHANKKLSIPVTMVKTPIIWFTFVSVVRVRGRKDEKSEGISMT
jgi:hypothetical protein